MGNATTCCIIATFCASLAGMSNWDDYRFATAVAQAGTVRGAARDLAVNPSTVTRRLDQIERRLGVRLFVRSSAGVELTAAGRQLVAALADTASQLRTIEMQLLNDAQSLRGEVRLVVSPAIAAASLMSPLAELQSSHPQLSIQWVAAWDAAEVETRDADLAVVAVSHPPADLVGRQAGQLALAGWAIPALAADWPAGPWLPSALQQACAPEFGPVEAPNWSWFATLEAQRAAAHAGLGATLLPVALARDDPRLVELPATRSVAEIWILSHPDARGVRRVQTVAMRLADALRR